MHTELSRDLELNKLKYDAQCKRVLGEKVMLAWIMKSVVPEYAEMDIAAIESCIEGEPEISSTRVNPGETNTPRVRGSATEDKVPDEGVIYYDIRFRAALPGEEGTAGIILNVEAQKAFRPGYSIVTRGIYYCARMLSAQQGTEFVVPRYDDIKKVVSIWICTNAPGNIGNAVTRFQMGKEDLVPGYPDNEKEYDKLSVVMICLNEKQDDHIEITELLNTVFSEEKTVEEKKEILQDRFHMEMEDGLGKELELMCNISDYIEERALLRGREEGRTEGTELERERGIGILVKALLEAQMPKERIIEQLMFNYKIDRETAKAYIKKNE